jgi:PAS domain S-box-containing protein
MAHASRSTRPTPPASWSLIQLMAGLAFVSAGAAVAAWVWPDSGRWLLTLLAVTSLIVLSLRIRGSSSLPGRPIPHDPLGQVAEQVAQLPPDAPELRSLMQSLEVLRHGLKDLRTEPRSPPKTQIGKYDTPPASIPVISGDPLASGNFSTSDMVNRLEPKDLRWLESSPAEQDFLGWSLSELRERSFLEVIHPDDRNLAREQLQAALIKGEAHGLVYRIKTAKGDRKIIEVNAGVRYGADLAVNHLRCHITDVTAQIRASRELRRRTRELTLVNQQLRQTNRELQELKDRYGDLYQNAPAMYFSLDERGYLLECNNTLLRTLGYRRDELIGRPYSVLLTESRRDVFPLHFADFLRTGTIEVESRWQKANGEPLDVWVTGTSVMDPDGKLLHSRSVAQDVTPRRTLEAELKEKNERLARTNVELARKNKELDEFSYVVSHDLQEPLRTLIAFSDFLMKDYDDRLDETGKEYLRYLVAASRRLKALISDLLDFSRVGKVTGKFERADFDEVVAFVRADLAELIRSKDGELRVIGPLPTLWADRARLGQLLANLVANGFKYNQSKVPVVEIGSLPSSSEGWATIFVRDNGIGIDPAFHAKIFGIFERAGPADVPGTGIGLAIVKKAVERMGGSVGVVSALDEGACFWVELPAAPLANAVACSA